MVPDTRFTLDRIQGDVRVLGRFRQCVARRAHSVTIPAVPSTVKQRPVFTSWWCIKECSTKPTSDKVLSNSPLVRPPEKRLSEGSLVNRPINRAIQEVSIRDNPIGRIRRKSGLQIANPGSVRQRVTD